MRVDPYKSKLVYESWKEQGSPIENCSEHNANLIRKFISDMENGTNINVSNKKGARSYIRLNAYKSKLKIFDKALKTDFEKVTKEDFNICCTQLRKGIIKRQDGQVYRDTSDYIKSFKAFWHWLMKVTKKKLDDVTLEAEVTKDKPRWVYLDEKQTKKFFDNCKPYYKTLGNFAVDSSQRATELLNTRVDDFENDFTMLNIRDEVAKTYGRKIKIMFSREMIKEYVADNKLKGDDLLFPISLSETNKYFKRKGMEIFGEGKSKAGEKYSMITIGDFRHISACYWFNRYKSQNAMMYRFGWKKADKIFYYSEFLGSNDNITQEDLLTDVTKTELEKQLGQMKKEAEMKNESHDREMETIKKQMAQLLERGIPKLKKYKETLEK
jgi:integrase